MRALLALLAAPLAAGFVHHAAVPVHVPPPSPLPSPQAMALTMRTASLTACSFSRKRSTPSASTTTINLSRTTRRLQMVSDEEAERNSMVADVLAEALPFIMRYSGRTVVIKYGGHAMENEEASLDFAKDVVMLKQCGVNPVVVHGGGPQIATMLDRLSIPTAFVEGLRVTDEATMQVAEMVLCGSINKGIASGIKQAGGRAVGLSGKDDNLISVTKYERNVLDPVTGQYKVLDVGFVGEIQKINTQILEDVIRAGIIPVIAPIGVDERGRTYNCNADTAAGAIAAALKANRLLLLTDVKGVLNKDKELLAELTLEQVEELKKDGTATGGMIPKLNTACKAVQEGVDASIILDGRVSHALLLELFTSGGAGTLIKS